VAPEGEGEGAGEGAGGPGGEAPDCEALRVVFAGTPAFAATALAALLASRHRVVGVLCQPDRPTGRGRKRVAGEVKRLARQHGVEVQQPVTLKTPGAREALAGLRPDVMVVAAYGLLLPPEVLALPPLGCINIHASLLPRWRGAAPVHRAILAGDARTGVAIMQMDAGLDTGAVLLQRAIDIAPAATSASLHDELAALGAELIVPALEGRCCGSLEASPQPATGVTYANKLDKREARLDLSRSAIELDRSIRAYVPWPVAETELDGERVRLWGSRLVPARDPADAPPGTVLALDGGGEAAALVIATGQGALGLTHLQRDGGRPMPADAFAHDRQLVGRRFGARTDRDDA